MKPDYTEAYTSLGNIQQITGRIDEAEVSYRKAIELQPDSFEAYNNLANSIKEIGKADEAIACYRKAIELKPDYEQSHYNLGLALYESHKFKEAIEEFKLNDFKNSKDFILKCLFKLDEQNLFFKELDAIPDQSKINAVIGSLISRAEVQFKTNRENLFCKNPLNYILHSNLTESCDFKSIFVKTIKDFLSNVKLKHKSQGLLTNGYQTAGNIFLREKSFIDVIQKLYD